MRVRNGSGGGQPPGARMSLRPQHASPRGAGTGCGSRARSLAREGVRPPAGSNATLESRGGPDAQEASLREDPSQRAPAARARRPPMVQCGGAPGAGAGRPRRQGDPGAPKGLLTEWRLDSGPSSSGRERPPRTRWRQRDRTTLGFLERFKTCQEEFGIRISSGDVF